MRAKKYRALNFVAVLRAVHAFGFCRYWPGKCCQLFELEKPVYEIDLLRNQQQRGLVHEKLASLCSVFLRIDAQLADKVALSG